MPERAPGSLTRQQLYDRIRESSKDEYILSEMIRLGYWDEQTNKPSLPAELIQQKGELERELRELVKKQSLYQNPEQALKELHKKRKKAALERREDTKLNANETRYQRSLEWYKKNQREITYLGKGHSEGLQGRFTDKEKLEQQGLPIVEQSLELATAMGVSINELRFLSFDRKTSKVSHYQQFLIAKKSGGTRRISAPMPRLKRLQYWILGNILEKLAPLDVAHGFIANRSIVTNAKDHVNKDVVVNMDLKDFFPSISYKRVKGLFCHFGYNEHIATILALICTAPEIDQLELDGEIFYVGRGERHLPQGAPTSPAISNLLCRRLDKRVKGIAKKLNFDYTRYADDLTFSASRKSAHHLQKLFWRMENIISDEGFVIHPDKTRIMRKNTRQEVTGIVVNEKLSIDRKTLKRFRALLFQIEKDGIGDKRWGDGDAALIPTIEGYANFVAMVNPEKGIALQKRVVQIKQKYGIAVRPGKLLMLNKRLMRLKAIEGQAPRADWWQPRVQPAPEKELTAEQLKPKKKLVQNLSSGLTEIQQRSIERNATTAQSSGVQTPRKSSTTGRVMLYLALGVFLLLIFLGK
jgi:RNA-directed DNA polymerase